jgi:hypothetical protein
MGNALPRARMPMNSAFNSTMSSTNNTMNSTMNSTANLLGGLSMGPSPRLQGGFAAPTMMGAAAAAGFGGPVHRPGQAGPVPPQAGPVPPQAGPVPPQARPAGQPAPAGSNYSRSLFDTQVTKKLVF